MKKAILNLSVLPFSLLIMMPTYAAMTVDLAHPSLSELIIGKQRNGPTGTVYLNYIKELTKFVDAENSYD